jgi:NAD(P)-dependent dehydrogenase (short-subunit alcohol dehydrogenase family)
MKKVFLTGASSGIGRATAELLAREGHDVWGTSRDVARLPQHLNIHPVRLDLGDSASIEEAFATAQRESGGLDVVINNAGSGHFGPAVQLTTEMLQEQFQTLVFAHVELCRLAIAAMPRGLLINVTSLAARLPVPFMSGYNAAKAAMASFTLSLQLELADRPLHIVDLQPADIATGFNDAIQRAEDVDARVKRAWRIADKNMRDAPPPEFVARRILDLLHDDNPPPRVTVGGTFQAQVAPVIDQLLPQRLRLWGLRQYYRI